MAGGFGGVCARGKSIKILDLGINSWYVLHLSCVVGGSPEEFSVEVHHGGGFIGFGHLTSYVDGKVSWFDHCEADSWSKFWLNDMLEKLGYPETPNLKYYWLLPGKDLSDGLRIIIGDADTNVMCSVVDRIKNLVVYFDGLPRLDKTNLKSTKKNSTTGLFSNPLSILQNTGNSLLEEIATNFGVSLGHDNVAIANISLIKARELAQEALHRADMKRRTQQEQKKEGLDVQRVEVHAANSETEAPLHMRWTGGT